MKPRRWLGVVALVVLTAAACGRSDTETEPSSTDDSSSSVSSDDVEAQAEASLAKGEFGDLGVLCKDGDPAKVTVKTPGLSDTEVHIATFSDVGFNGRPGLDKEFFDTAEAVVKWCNSMGGINGRKIVLDKRDAKLTEHAQRMAESVEEDFSLVGGGAVFDGAGQKARLAGGLPDFSGFMVTPEAADSQLHIEPVPNPIDSINAGDLASLKVKFPGAVDHLGVLSGNLSTTQLVADRNEDAAKMLGYKVVYREPYNAGGEDNWSIFIDGLKQKGVKGLVWIGEPENLAAFVKAIADDGELKLDFIRTDANHYDQKVIDLAGAALDTVPVFTRTTYWPFEDAEHNLATAEYLKLMETYNKNGKSEALLGAQGLSAWLLFLQAANTCDEKGTFTRDCIYDAGRVTTWTGGGLHSPQQPAAQVAADCLAEFQAKPDGFTQVDIGEKTQGPFTCDPAFVLKLTGDYGKGVDCPNPSDDPKPSTCGT